MSEAAPYFTAFAAAYVRGLVRAGVDVPVAPRLLAVPLEELSEAEAGEVVGAGVAAGVRVHRFKRTMGLRRVARVIGILRGMGVAELLDVGTGRGAFLWPMLDALPYAAVTAIDMLAHRARDLGLVRRGGVGRLSAVRADATRMPFADRQFDGVTFLETLEHIPDPAAALREAVRVARRFVVVSVPSKADDNPEHIHLFDGGRLREMFAAAGAANSNVEHVLNHVVAVARVA